MTKPSRPDPRPLFTPSTLPQPTAPDPVVAFIEDALIAIANRQDADSRPAPLPEELAAAVALEDQDRDPTTT
ncbi:MAG TPA: hypothetical protein VFH24_04130 [Gemmatimonadales bacterium]|nr:hypothetical protein [Gemmatimonadales bacterium]